MPVSADLLKVLAEDPKSLEQQLGCMAGLFQIFDRQGLGRRYGSRRVSNAGSGQSQPTSACETPRYDHHHHHHHHHRSNPYWMFEEDSSQKISGDSFDRVPKSVESTTREQPHHRPVYSDSSEIFTKSFETPTESRTSPDEKSNQSPMYSEESVVGGLASYFNDNPPLGSSVSAATSRYASFEHHHDDRSELVCKQLNVVVPARANFGNQQSSTDIRDIVRASFERDPRKEKPQLQLLPVDAAAAAAPQNLLPRSSSVDGKDRSSVPRSSSSDLPRSSSVGGRGASRMLADWKDGLRTSPRLTSKERDALRNNNNKQKPNSGCDARDVTRLTVELKEGPRLSVSVDDRRASVDGKVASPRPISRFRDAPTCEQQLPFKESLHRAPDDIKEFKKSMQKSLLRPDDIKEFKKESLRADEIKEFLRGESKKLVGRHEGHRFSVDGTRDAPRACVAPRLSVDGRDVGNETTALVARKLKLDSKESNLDRGSFCRQSSGRKASNVVARLMGLDELPAKDTTPLLPPPGRLSKLYDPEFLHPEFLHSEFVHPEFSPPPPPSPPDDYDYAHHDHEAFHRQRLRRSETESNVHEHFSSHHHQQFLKQELHCQTTPQPYSVDITPSEDVHAVKPSAPEEESYLCKSVDALHLEGKADQPRLVRKSPQGRRSLWHIFEAMQLKGLLHGSSRKKHAEAVRLHNLNMIEEKECQEVKERRSQSLPPRLSSVSKDLQYHDTPRVLTVSMSHGNAAFPRALELQANGAEAGEESCVVVKPIITRSMSYKAQAATVAPSQPSGVVNAKTDAARKSTPDEDTIPKNLTRALSNKNAAAYHRAIVTEMPLQEAALQAADSSNTSNSVRQSRKERGAPRMTKSSSDVPQSERDSSPRCPRGVQTNPQERLSARSCSPRADSSSVSPRCPGNVEGVRLVDAGKVRRKPFAVKDREESKASLAHLRANATKQEFLKERASGDPDTPRLLRRSSSESKLLSKIAEKPVNADIPSGKTAAGGRIAGTPPSMSLLRSKRLASKDNKSPMKTRPTSALGVRSAAKTSSAKERNVAAENMQTSHVNRPAKSCVPEAASTAAQEHKPAENKAAAPSRCSVLEVRATQGGALDQSGDATHSNARENRTESKAREKTIELDEGVKTPRGVSIKKIDFSEDAQAEVAEQPSPVSVLDNSHFDEELTPSPKAGKSSVVSLQEQSLRSEKHNIRWSSARFLDLDLEETTSSEALLKVPDSPQDETDSPSRVLDEPALQIPVTKAAHRHRLCVCLKDADEESTYVEELVGAAELGSGCSSPEQLLGSSTRYVMDPTIFDQLETKRGRSLELEASESEEKDALDRRILFDCVNEVLEKLLETQLTCMQWTGLLLQPRLRKRPVGHQLVKAVLTELEDIPCAASEDVFDTVYVILQKDLLKGRGQQWSDYSRELEEVGVVVERMILKDLIEETVRELSACFGQSNFPAAESSRRQLFA